MGEELTKHRIHQAVVECIQELLADTDLELDDPIEATTTLNADLCLTSVEAMELFAKLDLRLACRLPYEELVMIEGEYRDELTVGELVDFAWARKDDAPPQPRSM